MHNVISIQIKNDFDSELFYNPNNVENLNIVDLMDGIMNMVLKQ